MKKYNKNKTKSTSNHSKSTKETKRVVLMDIGKTESNNQADAINLSNPISRCRGVRKLTYLKDAMRGVNNNINWLNTNNTIVRTDWYYERKSMPIQIFVSR